MKALTGALTAAGETILLVFQAFLRLPRRPFELAQIARQIFLMGYRALGLLGLMAAFAGLVMAFQFGLGLSRFGAVEYMAQLTGLGLTREMVPVLTALVLGGRIVAGIAAELGAMVATEQVDAVRALGADPLKKLVMPRLVAAALVLPMFTLIGDAVGAASGMLVARYEFGVPMKSYYQSLRDTLTLGDVASGVIKAFIFGLLGAAIACRAGLGVRGGTAGVGRATTSAVVQASLTVVVADFLVTRVFAGWLR
jgi:phospholipid/cholesterol/gamma-HCH transport system permease protein